MQVIPHAPALHVGLVFGFEAGQSMHDGPQVLGSMSEAQTLPRIGEAVDVFWAPEHCRAFAQER